MMPMVQGCRLAAVEVVLLQIALVPTPFLSVSEVLPHLP